MKSKLVKFFLLIIFLLGISLFSSYACEQYNYYVEPLKTLSKKSYTGTFLGMDCKIEEYTITGNIGNLYLNDNLGIVNIQKREIKTKYPVEKYDYSKLLLEIGNNVYYVGKNRGRLGLYKNDKLVTNNFKKIYGLVDIDGKLAYFGVDKNGKNFYVINGKKYYTPNDWKIEEIKKLGNDLFILYVEQFGDSKNFHLYKNGEKYLEFNADRVSFCFGIKIYFILGIIYFY